MSDRECGLNWVSDLVMQHIKAQPPSIAEAVLAGFKHLKNWDMPALYPERVIVTIVMNTGPKIGVTYMTFDELKTELEGPAGDLKLMPRFHQARAELLNLIAKGAGHGTILFVQDMHQNFFLLPIGKVEVNGINAIGGYA